MPTKSKQKTESLALPLAAMPRWPESTASRAKAVNKARPSTKLLFRLFTTRCEPPRSVLCSPPGRRGHQGMLRSLTPSRPSHLDLYGGVAHGRSEKDVELHPRVGLVHHRVAGTTLHVSTVKGHEVNSQSGFLRAFHIKSPQLNLRSSGCLF